MHMLMIFYGRKSIGNFNTNTHNLAHMSGDTSQNQSGVSESSITRRNALKSIGSVSIGIASVRSFTQKGRAKKTKKDSVTTEKRLCGESGRKSENPQDLPKKTKEKLKERMEENQKKIQKSIKSNQKESRYSSMDIINPPGGIRTLDHGEQFDTQSGNYANTDSHILGDELGAAETDWKLQGVTNKAYALSHNYLAGDAWAWAETGTEFATTGSGRVQVSGKARYSGFVTAGGAASAAMTVEAVLIDTITGEDIASDTLWSPSSWVLPVPASKTGKIEQFTLEGNVDGDSEYAVVLRVNTDTTVLNGGDAWSDAWPRKHWADFSPKGYAQWLFISAKFV
jgi:hypothetical protein